MNINFIKLSPTQNMTILVENEVPRELHAKAAEALMAYDNVYAEQVGYIEKPGNSRAWSRLQMMFGEFCANATISLAAYLVSQKNPAAGDRFNVPLEVSGYDGIIECLASVEEDRILGTLRMPLPEKIENLDFPLDGIKHSFTTVFLPGITHVIVPVESLDERAVLLASKAAKQWRGLIKEEAFGIILFDEDRCEIKPLICVGTGTGSSLVWERGCGSGTAAVGAYLAVNSGKGVSAKIRQPGGIISVSASVSGGCISEISITGSAKIVARGTAYINI